MRNDEHALIVKKQCRDLIKTMLIWDADDYGVDFCSLDESIPGTETKRLKGHIKWALGKGYIEWVNKDAKPVPDFDKRIYRITSLGRELAEGIIKDDALEF